MANPKGIINHPGAFRLRVLAEVRAGKSTRLAAWHNGISQATVVRWCRVARMELKRISPLTPEQHRRRQQDILYGMKEREFREKHRVGKTTYYRVRREVMAASHKCSLCYAG